MIGIVAEKCMNFLQSKSYLVYKIKSKCKIPIYLLNVGPKTNPGGYHI